MGREWSLAAFTLLGQLAVGLYLFTAGPLAFFGVPKTWVPDRRLLLTAALVVSGLTAAAAGLSLFHLHHPLRAHKVLSNLGNSWLSREILFEILFAGMAASLAWSVGLGGRSAATVRILAGLGALAGLLFLASMARLYMLSSIQVWKTAYTPVSFVLASLVMGLLGRLALAGMLSPPPGWPERGQALAALVLLAASLAAAVLLAPRLGVFGARPGPSLRPQPAPLPALHAVRIALLGLGVAALAATLWGGVTGAAAGLGPGLSAAAAGKAGAAEGLAAAGLGPGLGLFLILSAFLFAAAGETLGRLLFYRV